MRKTIKFLVCYRHVLECRGIAIAVPLIVDVSVRNVVPTLTSNKR
jgi:hypothetical protein